MSEVWQAVLVNLASKGRRVRLPLPEAVNPLHNANPGNAGVAWHGRQEGEQPLQTRVDLPFVRATSMGQAANVGSSLLVVIHPYSRLTLSGPAVASSLLSQEMGFSKCALDGRLGDHQR
jgi:hypothetical protein